MTRDAMTCRETVRRLLDYVEERLRQPDRRALEKHLRVCPRCVELLESYRRTPDIVRRYTEARAPAQLTRRLRAIIAHNPKVIVRRGRIRGQRRSAGRARRRR